MMNWQPPLLNSTHLFSIHSSRLLLVSKRSRRRCHILAEKCVCLCIRGCMTVSDCFWAEARGRRLHFLSYPLRGTSPLDWQDFCLHTCKASWVGKRFRSNGSLMKGTSRWVLVFTVVSFVQAGYCGWGPQGISILNTLKNLSISSLQYFFCLKVQSWLCSFSALFFSFQSCSVVNWLCARHCTVQMYTFAVLTGLKYSRAGCPQVFAFFSSIYHCLTAPSCHRTSQKGWC